VSGESRQFRQDDDGLGGSLGAGGWRAAAAGATHSLVASAGDSLPLSAAARTTAGAAGRLAGRLGGARVRSRALGTASGLCRHRAASSMIREMIGGGTAALCARNPSPRVSAARWAAAAAAAQRPASSGTHLPPRFYRCCCLAVLIHLANQMALHTSTISWKGAAEGGRSATQRRRRPPEASQLRIGPPQHMWSEFLW